MEDALLVDSFIRRDRARLGYTRGALSAVCVRGRGFFPWAVFTQRALWLIYLELKRLMRQTKWRSG